jgi:23S rRNA (guanine2445-N2)-methyltransferase / 23S rRNA (guanine2069-N7)-methyltransferase
MELFCSGTPEITDLLAVEVSELGAARIHETGAGLQCTGTLETAYKMCLWSRLATKVYSVLVSKHIETTDDIYALARSVIWREQLTNDTSFAVFATMKSSKLCTPSFAALRVKDAIVDQFREASGIRPSVDTANPQMRFHLHVQRDQATLNVDLSGESLHRRGYRLDGVESMMKETVAASLLVRAGWPELARDGAPLIDPMCGSGTVPIEAVFIAGDRAPGLMRHSFGFLAWPGHDHAIWDRVLTEAKERAEDGRKHIPPIAAFDIDPGAIRVARQNAERADVFDHIVFRTQPITRLAPEPGMDRPGFVALDPPYGRRSGGGTDLTPLYKTIGEAVRTSLPGWRGAMLSAEPELSRSSGLWARKTNTLHNGALKCVLAQFEIFVKTVEKQPSRDPLEDEYREIFSNRLRKNLRALRKWRQKEGVSCVRVYDADVPEFAVAIDIYEDKWVNVQEYAPPDTVSKDRANLRLDIILETIPIVLGVSKGDVFFKERERQKKGAQYERHGTSGTFFEIREGGLRFLINLSDYLDSGLFLDHRTMRSRIRDEARGGRFLNLFSYTGTASVYAADGGAFSTTSVDLSNTYTDWAAENFKLNGLFDDKHTFVRGEVRKWIGQEKEEYDLIFLDPPTFSRSKSFDGSFQVQRDHPELIQSVLELLSSDGVLYFSTNYRRFRLDDSSLDGFRIEDITQDTIPFDFRRNKRVHSVFKFERDK